MMLYKTSPLTSNMSCGAVCTANSQCAEGQYCCKTGVIDSGGQPKNFCCTTEGPGCATCADSNKCFYCIASPSDANIHTRPGIGITGTYLNQQCSRIGGVISIQHPIANLSPSDYFNYIDTMADWYTPNKNTFLYSYQHGDGWEVACYEIKPTGVASPGCYKDSGYTIIFPNDSPLTGTQTCIP